MEFLTDLGLLGVGLISGFLICLWYKDLDNAAIAGAAYHRGYEAGRKHQKDLNNMKGGG